MSTTTTTSAPALGPATATSPRRRELPPLMTLTDAASSRLAALYAGSGEGAGQLLRISLNSKGCSGHAYEMSWVDAAGPGDEVVRDKGVTVLVDRKASLFLIGTVMNYEEQTLSAGFSFSNPNEKGRCGCGESVHF